MSDLTLELQRTYPAPAAVAYGAFVDPEVVRRWWGPEGFTVPALNWDAREGSAYRIEMQPPEGEAFALVGEFREVEPPARLAFTFVWEPPDPDDLDMLAELNFRDLGGSTEVTLRQGPFKTEARRELHHAGWTDSFDRLGRVLDEG